MRSHMGQLTTAYPYSFPRDVGWVGRPWCVGLAGAALHLSVASCGQLLRDFVQPSRKQGT